MTALAAAGTVDLSGPVAGILRGYRAVGARYAEEVKGDPGTVRAAAQAQTQQAQQLSETSRTARQRSTALAANWEGGAYDAYAARTGRACDQLDQTATKLQQQSQTLTRAATALETATQQMTAMLTDFDGKANRLIAEAHTAAPGAATAFIQAAHQLGKSLVDAGGEVRETLSRTLDTLAGNDPTKPGDSQDSPKIELWKKDSKYGTEKFLSTDLLDELMGKKPEPETAAGKLLSKTSVTAWKWDNDGKPLWEWGFGDKGHVRTDLPGGGGAGLEGSYHVGPQVTANAKLGLEDNQLSGQAGVKGTLLDLKGNAYATIGPGTVQADASGFVGAQADVNGKIGLDGGSLHAGAFAGAKVEGSVAGDLGGLGAGVKGSLQWGVGATADARATWDHGHIQIGFQAGAALGPGASIGGNVDIDLPKVWESYEKLDPVGAQALRDGATWVGNTASEASHAVGEALDWLGGK